MNKQKSTAQTGKLPGEIRIWHACIKQHYLDLFTSGTSLKSRRIRNQARSFLIIPNHNLERICNMLNYDYSYIFNKIKQIYYQVKNKKTSFEHSVINISRLLKSHHSRQKI
ncbi:MAG: hypothetical protein RLN62_01640 [Rickettsiales bacterium]